MATIGHRDLVLLLIGLRKDGKLADELGGMTRLQKLLYLLEKEEGLKPSGQGFEFAAYKAGPYSARVYDDLEFLENLGLLESSFAAEATDAEAAEFEYELSDLTFDDLLGDEGSVVAADTYREKRFQLTEEGREHVVGLLETGAYQPVVDGVRRVKSKYGSHSLQDLLYYVYKRYPEMTVESEIKDQVLARRR